jgi:hypothetical protein
MKSFSLLVLCFISAIKISAQSSVFMADNVTGNLYKNNTDTEIEGSRFLLEEWSPGIIYMADGHKAEKFLLKFDLYSNELLFLHEGKPLVVVNPVKEFIIKPVVGAPYLFRRGFQPVERNDEISFYQVVQDGPVSLLKHTVKIINERKEYNKAGVIKEFITSSNYFVSKANGEIIKIKKDKNSLISAIGDTDGKLQAWVEKNKLKCKTEEDMMVVVKGYNDNLYK